MTQDERYWKKVKIGTENECWEWVAAKSKTGYGVVGWNGRVQLAHRVAWEIENGPIPDGLCVCHKCDNRVCCNINHLFLGSNAENMNDMVTKGRQASGDRHGSRTNPWSVPRGDQHYSHANPERVSRGEQSGRAKVNEEKVRKIRILCAEGVPKREVAKKFDISDVAVSKIVLRKTWRHVL